MDAVCRKAWKRIQVLLPEKDIFKKEDQNRLVALFQKLDAEILDVPGGHVGFIVQSEYYIDLMEKFLETPKWPHSKIPV